MTPIRLSLLFMKHKHWLHGIVCVGGAQARSRPRWLRPPCDRGKDGRLRCHSRGGRACAVVETFLECAEQGANASRSAVRHRATSRCHRHTPLSRRPPWAAATASEGTLHVKEDAHMLAAFLCKTSMLPRSCPIAVCASCAMLSLLSKTRFARALLSAPGRVSTSTASTLLSSTGSAWDFVAWPLAAFAAADCSARCSAPVAARYADTALWLSAPAGDVPASTTSLSCASAGSQARSPQQVTTTESHLESGLHAMRGCPMPPRASMPCMTSCAARRHARATGRTTHPC